MSAKDTEYSEVERGTELSDQNAVQVAFGDLREEIAENAYDVVVTEGEFGYAEAGQRLHVGAFDIVVIDWMHPNYGYFSDGMLWIRSRHQPEWQPYPVANWTQQYKRVGEFLQEFPQFRRLFVDIAEDDHG